MAQALISPSLLRRLEQFQMVAARRAKSGIKGERRSRARGQSVEFADYRTYVPGDDFRYLDWNLYGRLDRLFLKLYEEERELPVTLFLDGSESMNFGQPRKFDWALKIAAAIGYVALCGFDRVTVRVFPENGDAAANSLLRPVRGRRSALEFFSRLEQVQPGGLADFNESLRRGALAARSVGVAIVLSDFLDPSGYEAGLNALVGREFEVSAIQILAPEELNPSQFGDLKLVDSERGTIKEVTFGRHRLTAYQKAVQNYIQRLREYCQKRGVHFFSTRSNASLEELLLKQLRQAEVWG